MNMENKKEKQKEKKYYILNVATGKDEEVSYQEWKQFNDMMKEAMESVNNFIKHE